MGKKQTGRAGCSLGRAVINARENLPAAKRKRNKLDLLKKQKARQVDVNSVPASVDDDKEFRKDASKVESITEQNDLEEFLAKCQLAGAQFTAERSHISVIDARSSNKLVGVASQLDQEQMRQKLENCREKYKEYLNIPRRPLWNSSTTVEQLQQLENEAFLTWRRKLAELEEVEQIVLTPFERNIEIWRQLWRVLERSHVVVQIVDARDPLLFRNEDLEAYINELSCSLGRTCQNGKKLPAAPNSSGISADHKPHKINVILLNKSDYLTENQRKLWCQYFNEHRIRCVFWSATDLNDEKCNARSAFASADDTIAEEEEEEQDGEDCYSNTDTDDDSGEEIEVEQNVQQCLWQPKDEMVAAKHGTSNDELNTPNLMSRQNFLIYLKNLKRELCGFGEGDSEALLSVGMIGYPNVGKSSTINKLLLRKKVAVSSTPGKTKHFQTLKLDDDGQHGDLMLCDCPGLVMPSLALSKEQMFLCGILSADQMRQFDAVIDLMCAKFRREVFERCYGLTLPKYENAECLKSRDLLTCLAFVRGFMSPKGLPDCSRAARLLVKDCVSGKLLYCQAPPTTFSVDQSEFFPSNAYYPTPKVTPMQDGTESDDMSTNKTLAQASSLTTSAENVEPPAGEILRTLRRRHLLDGDENATRAGLDRAFFGCGTEGGAGHVVQIAGRKPAIMLGIKNGRPPKKLNRNTKRDKLRRVYGYLDA